MRYIGNIIMAILLVASFVIKPSMFRGGKHSKNNKKGYKR